MYSKLEQLSDLAVKNGRKMLFFTSMFPYTENSIEVKTKNGFEYAIAFNCFDSKFYLCVEHPTLPGKLMATKTEAELTDLGWSQISRNILDRIKYFKSLL